MIKKYTLILFSLLFVGYLQSQNQCGDNIFSELQKSSIRNYEEIEQRNNLQIKNYIDNHYGSNASAKTSSVTTNYVIPVVFHIVHLTGDGYGVGTNISYNQILSQVNALNAAFSKSYPIYNGQTHPSYAQNTNIQFCLAKIAKPSSVSFYTGPGGIENGVMRYADNVLANHDITTMSATSLLGLTHPSSNHFPFTDYLNIWVVASIGSGGSGTVMGYAPKPIMGSYPLDGVVMRSDIIGDNSTGSSFALGFGLQQGKVLSHEIGHYLNLYHIFEGGCAGANAAGSATDACDLNGDGICDIEPCTTQNISCGAGVPNTCSATYSTGTTNLDMINSYMSYADDDCMNTFTMNQAQRMWVTLSGMRFNLWQNSNLSSTGIIGAGGCIASFLMTNINASTNNICAGTSVTLSNPTLGNSAITRNWLMPSASPSVAATNSVSIAYAVPGLYWAYLTISDGTLTAKDSFLVKVANCTLDSSRLDRAHWFFSDYAELDFTTPGGVTAGTSALTHGTMYHGREATVSMSDKKGNLLFYTDCQNFFDNNHIQRNVSTPIFPIVNAVTGSSTPGVIAIPFPKDSSKYIIMSSPHTGAYYDSIYYVVYDINTHFLSEKRGFRNPLLPSKFSEPLTVVPHCNGVDYWVVTSPKYDLAIYNAYSILITAAGPGEIDKVTVSYGMDLSCCGQLKSNRKGNKIAGTWNGTLFDFDNATGKLSNPLSLGMSGACQGTVFSPNDSLIYVLTQTSICEIKQIDLYTLSSRTISVPSGFGSVMMECGPDNNIYLSGGPNGPVNNIGRIINTNSWINAAFVPSAIVFPNGVDAFFGLCNFMDADPKPEIANDYLYSNITCNTFNFSVDSCWQVYNVSWNFGDGTTGTGLTVNHTYSSTGSFTVKMTLSIGTYSLATVIKNITVLLPTSAITGPSVICKGSTFLNNYSAATIPGATYNWGIVNASIAGPVSLSNVNVGSSGTGIATLTVQVINGGCTSVATKTIVIDTVPMVSSPIYQPICVGDLDTLTGSPIGGIFSGPGVTSNVFNSSVAGLGSKLVYYTFTNANGCFNTATSTITVNACVGINEINNDATINLYPNPNNGLFNLELSTEVLNASVEIYNHLGQLVYTDLFHKTKLIDMSNESNGMYFVRVLEDNKTLFTKKIIKE